MNNAPTGAIQISRGGVRPVTPTGININPAGQFMPPMLYGPGAGQFMPTQPRNNMPAPGQVIHTPMPGMPAPGQFIPTTMSGNNASGAILPKDSHKILSQVMDTPIDKSATNVKLIAIACAISAAVTIFVVIIFYYVVIDGAVKVPVPLAGIADSVFARGLIMLWYPPSATITSLALAATYVPEGWAICDGSKGTPDLRGRFVMMAADTPAPVNGGTVHPVRQLGGEETHVLTVAELASHYHGYNLPPYGGGGGPTRIQNHNYGGYTDNPPQTYNTGENQPHNTLPPFYSLIYIMRV